MEYLLQCSSSWHPQEVLESGASFATSELLLKSKDVKLEPLIKDEPYDGEYGNGNTRSLEELMRDECICNVCGEQFLTAQHLKAHSGVHVETHEKPYKCQQCDKSFNSKSGLWRHTKQHTGETIYECNMCDKTFTRRPRLKKHLEAHKKVQEVKYEIKCEICNRPFDCKYNFERHMKIHSTKDPNTCEVCGKTFSNKSNLKTHTKRHLEVMSTAGATYNEMSTIQLAPPSDERNYKCEVCDKTFKSKHYLKEHARIHSDTNPYKCLICDKQLSCKANLMVHVRTHIRKGTSHNAEVYE